MKRIMLIILVSLFIVGCAATVEPKSVHNVRYEVKGGNDLNIEYINSAMMLEYDYSQSGIFSADCNYFDAENAYISVSQDGNNLIGVKIYIDDQLVKEVFSSESVFSVSIENIYYEGR
jgi:hypothetical protein